MEALAQHDQKDWSCCCRVGQLHETVWLLVVPLLEKAPSSLPSLELLLECCMVAPNCVVACGFTP
jgi:hypothetical protein